MIQKVINVYSYDELSEEAQDRAVEWWLNGADILLDSIEEDAANIGLKITSYDTYRGDITGELTGSIMDTCDKIRKDHGSMCETYKLAENYIQQWDKLVSEHSTVTADTVDEDKEYEFDQKADDLEAEFLSDLLEEYLSMLRREYEYQTSRECVEDNIRANEYEFTEDGKIA